MKSTIIWLMVVGAILLFDNHVMAWNRQFFNRHARNFMRNGIFNLPAAAAPPSPPQPPAAMAVGGNGNLNELNALFGIGNNGLDGKGNVEVLNGNNEQQQTEVYGIVEPLIEDMPCVDRPCIVNDDCCPAGVCVYTYGEGKCIYVYGRKRDLCHRNADCELGMSCLKGPAGNMVCEAAPPLHLLNAAATTKTFETRQFGEECETTNDCNVAKGMCCQMQRSHNRLLPKKLCAYFRDPFMCIDIMPTDNEEIREARYLSAFKKKRM